MNLHIDKIENMTHILSNLPESYNDFEENIKDKMDDDVDILSIKRVCAGDKLSEKYYQMNLHLEMKNSIEDGKFVYVKTQYKGTCTICGKYGEI